MATPSLPDLYWLAGLFEGEGSIVYERQKDWKGCAVKLQLTMTDEDVMRRAGAIMDVPVYGPYQPPVLKKDGTPRKMAWNISIGGSHGAAWGMTLYVLLGQRRQARLREILTAWRISGSRQYKKRRGLYDTKVSNTSSD